MLCLCMCYKIGSDYSSACPDVIQIKGSLFRSNCVDRIVMVTHYAFYALGFRFESHLADFGFVFFLSTFLLFFFLYFFSG